VHKCRGQASHTFNAADSDDDENAPTVVGAVEEGAMQYDDDLRANFPMAFGANSPPPQLTAVNHSQSLHSSPIQNK